MKVWHSVKLVQSERGSERERGRGGEAVAGRHRGGQLTGSGKLSVTGSSSVARFEFQLTDETRMLTHYPPNPLCPSQHHLSSQLTLDCYPASLLPWPPTRYQSTISNSLPFSAVPFPPNLNNPLAQPPNPNPLSHLPPSRFPLSQ